MTRPLHWLVAAALLLAAGCARQSAIDRRSLVDRNAPRLTQADTLGSLTVGNGEFAFTADITGLQTFPETYSRGIPLGTQSQWGWHAFPNPEGYACDETLRDYDFGRGRKEPYAVESKEPGRHREAANWYRANPHRLHLGAIGFEGVKIEQLTDIDQRLDLWHGTIRSSFAVDGTPVEVRTACDPDEDMVAVRIRSSKRLPVVVRFPYPTGGHADDACDWSCDGRHSTRIVAEGDGWAVLRRTLDETTYYVKLSWQGAAPPQRRSANAFVLQPRCDAWSLTAAFSSDMPAEGAADAEASQQASARYWPAFWQQGGAVDFSRCTDPRARELERRTVLSQYLLAVQCAGSTPPQETGLTYNSWFGKFHLEMIWWHQAHFALWGRQELLTRTMPWYGSVAPVARRIARRQGFEGLRWMKMTDPSGTEAPSKVGSFLIWQQPHYIYLAELLYRANPTGQVLEAYCDLVQQTAAFMASFAQYDPTGDRYVLRGAIPAQETLRAAETVNPPFELSYWHFALSTAQKWRERTGRTRDPQWDEVIAKLSPLAEREGLYLAAESATETYHDIRFTSDHMAVLGALGILPECPLVRPDIMHATFDWIYDNWNWNRTWGWDYPMTAMNAVRLGEPEKAIDALLTDKRTNTYLVNGHNYQDTRLRCYLPGNGGLLTAVALMCAGWDGCPTENPGFPRNGAWDVRWEGLKPLP